MPDWREAQPPATVDLVEMMREIKPVLNVTLDQIVTYLAVCEKAKYHAGGAMIGREKTSARQMVEKLESRFASVAGTDLIQAHPGRGSEIEILEPGKRVREMCQEILVTVYQACRDLSLGRLQPRLRIGLSRFMIPLLNEIDKLAEPRLAEVRLTPARVLYHVSSDNVQTIVKSYEVDFCLGAIRVDPTRPHPVDDMLEFVKLKDERLGLLSSHNVGVVEDLRDLPRRRVPLIIPTRGIINELLLAELTKQEYEDLTVVEYSNDAYFSLDTILLGQHRAAMIGTRSMYDLVKDSPNSEHLRFQEFQGCSSHLEIGLLRRKGDRERFPTNHPLRILWDAFEVLVEQERTQ